MKWKKSILILLIALIIVAMAVLYLQTRPVLIGAIIPAQTPLGNEENLFVRYYKDRHPRIGLRRVEFIIVNHVSAEYDVRNAYKEMGKKGVLAVIGGVISQEGVWLSGESAKSSIPTFGITSSSSQLSGKKDSFFRIVPTNDYQAAATAEHFNRLKRKRMVMLTDETNASYAQPIVEVMQRIFRGETLSVPYTRGDKIYKEILKFEPDTVFCILQAKDVIDVIITLRQRSKNILIGSSSWGSAEILQLYSSPLLDGVLFFTTSQYIENKEFNPEIIDFEKKYGMKAAKGAHYTASVLHILYDALKKGNISRQSLNQYFEIPRIYTTAYGNASMDEYGDSILSRGIVMETRNGVVYKTEKLTY